MTPALPFRATAGLLALLCALTFPVGAPWLALASWGLWLASHGIEAEWPPWEREPMRDEDGETVRAWEDSGGEIGPW